MKTFINIAVGLVTLGVSALILAIPMYVLSFCLIGKGGESPFYVGILVWYYGEILLRYAFIAVGGFMICNYVGKKVLARVNKA